MHRASRLVCTVRLVAEVWYLAISCCGVLVYKGSIEWRVVHRLPCWVRLFRCWVQLQRSCLLSYFFWGLPGGGGDPPAGHTKRNQANPIADKNLQIRCHTLMPASHWTIHSS